MSLTKRFHWGCGCSSSTDFHLFIMNFTDRALCCFSISAICFTAFIKCEHTVLFFSHPPLLLNFPAVRTHSAETIVRITFTNALDTIQSRTWASKKALHFTIRLTSCCTKFIYIHTHKWCSNKYSSTGISCGVLDTHITEGEKRESLFLHIVGIIVRMFFFGKWNPVEKKTKTNETKHIELTIVIFTSEYIGTLIILMENSRRHHRYRKEFVCLESKQIGMQWKAMHKISTYKMLLLPVKLDNQRATEINRKFYYVNANAIDPKQPTATQRNSFTYLHNTEHTVIRNERAWVFGVVFANKLHKNHHKTAWLQAYLCTAHH